MARDGYHLCLIFGARSRESYAADIRAARHRPHPKHWQALARLAGLDGAEPVNE
jgi:hypothetical protein